MNMLLLEILKCVVQQFHFEDKLIDKNVVNKLVSKRDFGIFNIRENKDFLAFKLVSYFGLECKSNCNVETPFHFLNQIKDSFGAIYTFLCYNFCDSGSVYIFLSMPKYMTCIFFCKSKCNPYTYCIGNYGLL